MISAGHPIKYKKNYMSTREKRICSVFIFDGFADHEVALTMAWLTSHGDFTVETFSANGLAVTSMSGLRVLPHTTLEKTNPEFFDLLLLPGGEKWEKGDNLEIFPLIQATVGVKPIAAICGGTLALGDLGLLNGIPHTSNFPGYIKQFCADYEGANLYQCAPFVNAKGKIITANGAGIIDLAYEILKIFGVFDEEKAQDWRELYQTGGQMQAFFGQ
jgi:putative intracellular protease/amidase